MPAIRSLRLRNKPAVNYKEDDSEDEDQDEDEDEDEEVEKGARPRPIPSRYLRGPPIGPGVQHKKV